MSDFELMREFQKTFPSWDKYAEFASSDPEGWKSLISRREKLANGVFQWLEEKHGIFHTTELQRKLSIGWLLMLPKATDEELSVRPGRTSLIQYSINEAVRKDWAELVHLRSYVHSKFVLCRATYRKEYGLHEEVT